MSGSLSSLHVLPGSEGKYLRLFERTILLMNVIELNRATLKFVKGLIWCLFDWTLDSCFNCHLL